jgi:UDP-2,3-diacylglucosamine pyrophosphatase LpxH
MGKVAFFISDLHLGRGDELDDFPSENENALAEFLDYQSQQYRGHDIDMVVLGDFLDIWQVTDESEKKAQEGTDISIDLVEDDQIRRVNDIVKAHPLAFDRLGAFLRSEPERHRAIFVIGNHDHSLVSDRVQKVICSAISGGDARIESSISFRHFYDEPGLRTYAEHGNQYDANNRYKKFVEFGDECPGHYFVRIIWNRLEPLEPNLETYVEGWWNCFRAIWRHKLWRLLKPALEFFRQYRTDPRPFERIDIPGVPFFAASGAPYVSTTGKPLAGFPDLLFSDFVHPQRIFSTDNQTEDQLRDLYHDPDNREFREWVDEILREKFGAQAPPVPSTRVLSVPTYGLFHDENVSAVAGMFAPPGETPRTSLLRASALNDIDYDYVIFGHTHEEKLVPLIQRNATYFNTGTWSMRRDPQGKNISRLCFVKITKGDDSHVSAVQDFWRPSGQRYDTAKVVSFAAPRIMPGRAITAVQPRLLEFFTRNHRPGVIGIVGTRDAVGLAIREAQRAVTRDGTPSLWSHCFILGDFRLDRRGPDSAVTRSPYLFESDLRVQITQPQIRNGAQENWIGKWCKGTVEHAALINFNLTSEQTEAVLATALQLADEQATVLYPIQELLGTWLAIITRKQWLPNPFDDPRAMYCSSFVRHCYQQAGRDFLDQSVSVSNTTPEDIAKAAVDKDALIIYKP